MRRRHRKLIEKKAAIACLALFMLSALVVYKFGAAALPSVDNRTADVAAMRTGTILIPDRSGQCRRLSFDNDNGEIADRGVGPCTSQSSSGRRGELPATLQGFQDAVRGR
jgi:hypothetical protein